ncbi:O-antigen ligase domain-containing protein [Paenibacillus sp. H1-7]|uniref:O-antigen ligase family protein n=1 Tax=Paenibacillus sp. H1-7 TaxID=2282849 RepID=UPI001EF935BC|nr:O-antigen ligase family protein [Paenibacillus sp. H1-7]ULL19044.1 O-antigen ligase domain-containing protein [Paenibacillus sp. H1-7]
MEREKIKHKYSSNSIKSNSAQKQSIIFWLLSVVTLIFLVWAPFQKGLFNGNTFDFERPIYTTLVWSSIILFLISIYVFYNWKLTTLADILAIGIWLIPISYFISSFFAASDYFSHNMLLIQVVYLTFFLIGYLLCREKLGVSIVINGIMATGYIIVWFGLLNWFGNKESAYSLIKWFSTDMPGLNYYRDAVMGDANGVRLTSVFQYANSYAAFLIALMIASVYLVSISKKWSITLYHSFMIIPIIVSFLVTLSRGALVILPVVILLVFIALKPYRQIIIIIYSLIASILTLLILEKITDIGVQVFNQFDSSLSMSGWTTLLLVSVIFSIICLLLQKYIAPRLEIRFTNINQKRFANIYIPITAIIVGSIGIFLLLNTGFINILPDNLKNRIETINFEQNSVLERGTFYKDAFKLFEDHPVVGAGGGAWAALYEKYQNNPYVSRQAHNFFLQYLVEVGIVGFLVLLIIVGAVFTLFIRDRRQKSDDIRFVLLIVTVSLLIHSMMDFDLSYVYLGVVLFLSLGAMISQITTLKTNEAFSNLSKYKWIYPSLVLIVSIIMFFNSAQLLNANSNFNAALSMTNAKKSINEIFVPLDEALKVSPNHPDYASYKIEFLLQAFDQTKDEKFYNEALNLIHSTRAKEPYNRQLIDKEVYALAMKEQLPTALELINKEIINFPWDITMYEKSILLNFDLGNRALNSNNTAQAKQYWAQASQVYNMVLEKSKELEALPKGQIQGRAFGLTKNMAFTLGQIEFMNGKYDTAESFLKFQLNDQFDDQQNKQMTRWYLASLQKQNKNDQALYDKLIAKDSKEKDEINRLVNATFSVK